MSATALTPLARTNPGATPDGVVYTLTTALTGTNNDLVFTGKVKGIKFSVTYTDPGGAHALVVALAESATGYDITVTLANSGAAITSTAADISTALAADALIGQIVSIANDTGNDGTGVVTALTKTNATGGTATTAAVRPDDTFATVDPNNGNTWTNTGKEYVLFRNTDSGPSQVVFTSTDALTTYSIDIPTGNEVSSIGPFPTATWGTAPTFKGIDNGLTVLLIDATVVATNAETAEETEDQTASPSSAMSYALAALDYQINQLDSSGDPGSFVSIRNLLKVRRDLARLTRLVTNAGARNHEGN